MATRRSYGARAANAQCALTRELFELMERKKTNLAVSPDVTSAEELLKIARTVGPYICVLKVRGGAGRGTGGVVRAGVPDEVPNEVQGGVEYGLGTGGGRAAHGRGRELRTLPVHVCAFAASAFFPSIAVLLPDPAAPVRAP